MIEKNGKALSPEQRAVRLELFKKLSGYSKGFKGEQKDRQKKLNYIYFLTLYHFHPYAIRRTYGFGEKEYSDAYTEDVNFRRAVDQIKYNFTENLEYAMLCSSGFFGKEKQHKYSDINPIIMGEYIKVRRYTIGLSRRLEGQNWKGQAGAPTEVPPGRDSGAVSIAETE